MGAETALYGIGLGLDAIGGAVQQARTKNLMALQMRNQMELNKQGQELQLETWEKTNFPAQIKMLKEAGLNPSLMYAKGGSGGVTGSQGGGSASMGAAPQRQHMNIADIMSMKQIESATEANKAQARKTNAEAKLIEEGGGGKQAAETAAQQAQAGKAEAETKLIEVNKRIAEIEESNKQSQIDAGLKHTAELIRQLRNENLITEETSQAKIKLAQEEAVGATLDNELTSSKIRLTDQERQNLKTTIVQKWSELSIEREGVKLKDKEVQINKFKAELEAEYPGAMQVVGSVLNKAWKSLENFGTYIGQPAVETNKVNYK